MDLARIGAFLAQLRREKGYTQEALGEKLGVTNKTVSRWENGNYLPGADLLLALSEEYGVTINEILCGERFGPAEYQAKAEETMCSMVEESTFLREEKLEFWKQRWRRAHRGEMAGCAVVGVFAILLAAYLDRSVFAGVLVAVILLAIGIVNYNRMMSYAEKKTYGDPKTEQEFNEKH